MEPRSPASPDLDILARLLAAQQDVSSSLAELPPSEQLFNRLLGTVCDVLGWTLGTLWQWDADLGCLTCSAAWNAAGDPAVGAFAAASLDQHFAPGAALPGGVWESQEPVWVPELLWDPRMASVIGARRAGLESAVAVPLTAAGQPEGVLEFFGDDVRAPEPAVLTWLGGIGAQIAQHLVRWRTHEALLGRERALAAATNGVVLADATQPGLPIVYVNPGFERLTGYAAEDVLGRSCSLLQGPGTDPAAVAALRDAIAERREFRVTLRNYRRDGAAFWNEVTLSPVVDDAGAVVQYVGVQSDVTERRTAEDRARFLAYHDALTGLANRARLQEVLERVAAEATGVGRRVALLELDLDRFKEVNDFYGHAVGDELLLAVADRLRAVARPDELLVRQGGDEFLLVIPDLGADAAARALTRAERIQAALADPVVLRHGTVGVRCSIGISVLGRDAADTDALLRHADVAMYRAKRIGGGIKLFHGTAGADAIAALPPADPLERALRDAALDDVLAARTIRPLYQPIVALDTGEVIAYEALARGPEGSPVAFPDALFGAARDTNRLGELDWACRVAAVGGALDAGLRRALFVNVEPEALGLPCPEDLQAVWDAAGEELDVVVEITERALTARPAELLSAIAEMRERGWRVALDDVGADVRSLALMPLLRPDVIKLDLRLVQEQPSTEVAAIVNAVCAESERTGALVLAEGIETPAHLAMARAMGATLGQGWLFGRPAPLDGSAALPGTEFPAPTRVAPALATTPYEAVRAHRAVRAADKRLLLSISMHLESQAAALGETGIILSAFQGAERFTPLTAKRYALLGADAAFVAALGVGMAAEPVPGVRGAALAPGDPLLGEWSVVVLGPHFAAALVAVDLGDTGPESERRFDFALTYDRELVIAAAAALMTRVTPLA